MMPLLCLVRGVFGEVSASNAILLLLVKPSLQGVRENGSLRCFIKKLLFVAEGWRRP